MRFIHYSSKPIANLIDCDQNGLGAKPSGLWFSVGDEWKTYVERRVEKEKGEEETARSEGEKYTRSWHLECLKFETEIVFASDAKRILDLKNADGIDAFTKKYGKERAIRPEPPVPRLLIDWSVISKVFDAVIVAPHCEKRQTPNLWYYEWDVASGCVWNARAATLKPINY